jgi:excisionase family DNA binding protein
MEDQKLALRPAQVAVMLEISRSKTYELISRGEIPSIRIGSSVRVPVGALQAWVERRLAAAGAEVAG